MQGVNDRKGMLPIRFGTDGWRAKNGPGINRSRVCNVAAALAEYCKRNYRQPSCVVGYDGRRDSAEFAAVFSAVLQGSGVYTVLSDAVIPTPCISFYTKKHGFSAGVMITASHNPPEYNGIKFKGPYGGPYMNDMTREVEQLLGETAYY
ncbi:MAG: hypothetical protein U5N56_08625 [Candidatus Marinimicrobia bacterium]|nr:hypothetical protein [Candidatus Neomarinimicrobiota bacterium]